MVAKMSLRDKWENGKRQSLRFYKRKSKWKFETFNMVFPLADYFGEMIGDKKEVSIADIGAGMVATTGSTWRGVKVKLYPSDVLANEYNQILRRKQKLWGEHLENGYKPLFPVVYQDMESLTYKDNTFDIVHCVNALDHCANPHKAIKEMYRVCKIGGWIYLRHFPNNAVKQGYVGLHQWNINYDWGDCLFESEEKKFLLSDCVSGFKNIIDNDGYVVSMLKKVVE